jgi:hypothetical protein
MGAAAGPTKYPTGANTREVRCGMCGDLYHVDASTFDQINAAVQQGLDNPFRCQDCEEEYDDLAYEG